MIGPLHGDEGKFAPQGIMPAAEDLARDYSQPWVTLLSPSSGSRLKVGVLINHGVAMTFHIHELHLRPAGLVVVIYTTDDLGSRFFRMNSA